MTPKQRVVEFLEKGDQDLRGIVSLLVEEEHSGKFECQRQAGADAPCVLQRKNERSEKTCHRTQKIELKIGSPRALCPVAAASGVCASWPC